MAEGRCVGINCKHDEAKAFQVSTQMPGEEENGLIEMTLRKSKQRVWSKSNQRNGPGWRTSVAEWL